MTLFSSNLHRIQSLLDVAAATGRRVFTVGRSLIKNVELGRELGYIELPHGKLLATMDELASTPASKVLIISTGSQGEGRAALPRIVRGGHRQIRIERGDTVLFSSRVIPGNALSVAWIVDELSKSGAHVVIGRDAQIHTSGHACYPTQKKMLEAVEPEFFVPIHGTYSMLQEHADLAVDTGAEPLMLDNGDVLEFTSDAYQVLGPVHSGQIFVHANIQGSLYDGMIKARKKLARVGVIAGAVSVNLVAQEIVAGPTITASGVVLDKDLEEVIVRAEHAARVALDRLSDVELTDLELVKETLRLALRRYFKRVCGDKPVVIALALEAG